MMAPHRIVEIVLEVLDIAKVQIVSGAGGNGCVSFRREKFIEFGGPMAAMAGAAATCRRKRSENLNTLIDYRYQQHVKAKNGQHGMGREMTGANGADAVLRVPVGTAIYEEDGETPICDLVVPGERVLLLKGGRGGFGNAHFKSATNRAPRRANPGQPAEEKAIVLQLKLIADAGLIGLPNAGKFHLLPVSRRRGRKSPAIRSPRWRRNLEWCAATRLISCSPIFPG